MASRKIILFLLVPTIAVAGIAYLIVHRSAAAHEHEISQAISSLDLSRLPDTFKAKLVTTERVAKTPHASKESILELARLYHANGFFREAQPHYQSLLDATDVTLRAKAHYYLASIKITQNDLPSAIQHLGAALKGEPSYLPAHLSLAEIHFKSGRWEESVSSYKAALDLDPSNSYALIGLARERIQQGDDATALVHLETLIAANPNFTNGSSLLAQVLERNGQSEKATIARSRSLAGWDLPPEDPWMDETMELCYDPQRLGIFFEDYKRVGQIERAMGYLDRIENVDPRNWNSRLLRAHTYTEMGEHSKSIPYYEQSLELGGDPAMIYPLLAKTYFELAQYDNAESVARKGLLLSPNNTEVLETMAGIHLQKREPKEAITLFRKVVSIDPYHHLANTVLAKFYWQTGDRTAAFPHLKTLRQVDPNDVFSRVFLGQYYLESNRPYEALPPLEEAFAIDPKDEYVLVMLPDTYAMIGKFQQNKGDFKGAMESYEKALAIDSNHAAATEGKVSLLNK